MFKHFSILFTFLSTILLSNAQVAPLLKSTWNQGCYYNDSCPTIVGGNCNKAYTGCNATAMGQIVYFHKYPATAWSTNTYTPSSLPEQSVNYNLANYNYTIMANNLTSANVEVAKLLYHLGVSVDMDYSKINSTSFFTSKALKKYYKYSPKAKSESIFLYPDTIDWQNVVKKELDAGRPVLASGGGHFYIIDGYQISPLKFHCNFGWGGLHNNYYYLSSINAAGYKLSPTNLITNIMPLKGTIEIKPDTFNNSYNVNNLFYEFSSLQNWRISVSDSTWIKSILRNGLPGYYQTTVNNCKIELKQNLGQARKGWLIIQNATEKDTIHIFQNANPSAAINNAISNNFVIYPNPFSNTIQLKIPLNMENFNLHIYNNVGKQVLRFNKVNSLKMYDVNTLKSGMYIFTITQNGKSIATQKLVKY